jgi:hypothetical protein
MTRAATTQIRSTAAPHSCNLGAAAEPPLRLRPPGWTTYDAAFYGVELPKDVPASQQQKDYTSPIWYAP